MSLPLTTIRKVAAEVLAASVLELFPGTMLVSGGVSQIGFWYDFAMPQEVAPDLLSLIEEKMRALAKENVPVEPMDMMRRNAMEMFRHFGQELKIEELAQSTEALVCVWRMGKFYDVVSPPYGSQSSDAGFFKLQQVLQTGDYTRISGTAFADKQELKNFLKKQEAAKRLDHTVIGKEMQLLFEAGGNYYLTDKGELLKELLSPLSHNPKAQHVSGPKPLVFNSRDRFFKDLPICFKSVEMTHVAGEGAGFFAENEYEMDEEQIFCLPSQIEAELISSLQFIDKSVNIFGFEHQVILRTKSDKRQGALENWDRSVEWAKKALKQAHVSYVVDAEEKAENGPVVEWLLKDALGRSWKGPFLSIDLRSPAVFGLRCHGLEGQLQKPLVIKRSTFGPIERFIALLIEKFGGMFPLWLAPEQVRVLPIAERNAEYARSIKDQLEAQGLRVGIDFRNENLGAKVHAAEIEKAPYMLIVGDKEEKNGTVTVRKCMQEANRTGLKIENFLEHVQKENDLKMPE